MTGISKGRTETADVSPTGGHRSLEILGELADDRATAIARASRAVSEIVWAPAQPMAIQRDPYRTVWHAGHVSALLSNGNDVIAGTQTGGVWHLEPIVGPSYSDGYRATPLSDSWDTPDVTCLAFGPEGFSQVFVGCNRGSALFLLEFDLVMGSMVWKQTTPLPFFFGTPTAIVTFADPRRIVVATNQGVWWSPIPQPATKVSGYKWRIAQELPTAHYSGLAAGPSASVAVAICAVPPNATTPPPASGIYHGTFQGNALVFTQAQITGIDPDTMRRTSLASCEDHHHRDRIYAVVAAADEQILAVLSSLDGGATWSTRTAPDKAEAGGQGSYNNCIAVSPQDPDLVVIGWRSGGPFLSEDGAVSWKHLGTDREGVVGSSPHLHADLHALYLGRNSTGPPPLYIGSDGGVVVTRDMGQYYESQFNRNLNNLQFYGGDHATINGSISGTLTASSRYPGLLAGGTQDNGNVYCRPDTPQPGIPRRIDTPWLQQVGGVPGDGDINRFVDPLGVLLNFLNTDPPNLRMARWDEQTQRFIPDGSLGDFIPANDSPGGVSPTSVEVVQAPAFKKNGQLMYAAVGSGTNGAIYGFFADPNASNAKLIRLGTIGASVTAISSITGSTLLVGTATGRIFSFNSASGIATEHTLPTGPIGVVYRLEAFNPVYPYLSPRTEAFALVGGRILHFNGTVWETVPTSRLGSNWKTFAADPESGRLFAATDGDVFVSHDLGLTWVDASYGLPTRPHCTDLRVATAPSGGRDLWLATWGRSVWRATIALPPGSDKPDWDVPEEMGDVLFGVIQDGGGVFRIGRRLVKVGPRPLLRYLIAALSSEDLEHSMSPESTTNAGGIRRVAGTIPALAAEALKGLWGLLRRER